MRAITLATALLLGSMSLLAAVPFAHAVTCDGAVDVYCGDPRDGAHCNLWVDDGAVSTGLCLFPCGGSGTVDCSATRA